MNTQRNHACSVHPNSLADARSALAALADTAQTFLGSVEYERVLLQLDSIHGDNVPALDTTGLSNDRGQLRANAQDAIEALACLGTDALQIELVLAMLRAAHAADEP